MATRPIASFAAAATLGNAAMNPAAPPASFDNGYVERNPEGGVPRAVIPAMEEMGVGSGVGSDYASAGYELSGAPPQPVPRRFTFEPGASFSPGAMPGMGPATREPNWAENFARNGADAPATLPRPDQIADLKPLGQVSASFIVAVNGEGLWIVG